MHEGETIMLGIPPEQAYGSEGTPDCKYYYYLSQQSHGIFIMFFHCNIPSTHSITTTLLTARIPGGATLFFKVQLLEILSASIGGEPTLLGADGKKLTKQDDDTPALLGPDGKPLF